MKINVEHIGGVEDGKVYTVYLQIGDRLDLRDAETQETTIPVIRIRQLSDEELTIEVLLQLK